jgi:multidrug efflux system membrane fusion protein
MDDDMSDLDKRGIDEHAAGRSRSAWKTWHVVAIIVIVAILLGGVGYWLAHSTVVPDRGGRFGARSGASGPGAPAMPVGTATATTGDINIYLDGLGTVTPLRNVSVSAQVSGRLLNVQYKEGQMVNQGDLLAEIDPRSYQAALNQAQGTQARDAALLANAKLDLERYQTLFKEDSIAKQQLDSQQSLVHQYEGTVQSDQGQIDTAKVNLAYTKIVAPLTGRVGLRQVDPGNNVQAGGASSIVVITQTKPIDVLFTIPEDGLPGVLKQFRGGKTLAVDALDRDKKTKLASGALASIDNQIDTATGTVKVKAEFGNDDESLFPNQFVNVRVLLDVLRNVIVIPTSALERGSQGLYVYVVKPDRTVEQRAIQTGPTEGERVAVTSGLQVGDMVVTDGADKLREGSKVELPGDKPTDETASPQTGQHRGRRGGTDAKGVKPESTPESGKDASPAKPPPPKQPTNGGPGSTSGSSTPNSGG